MGALSPTAESDMMYAADRLIAFTDDALIAQKAANIFECAGT